MPQFTNWEWQGEGDYYSLAGIDPMGCDLYTYHTLAEIRRDAQGRYVGWLMLSRFKLMLYDRTWDGFDPYWENIAQVKRAIEVDLILDDIIKEKPIDN